MEKRYTTSLSEQTRLLTTQFLRCAENHPTERMHVQSSWGFPVETFLKVRCPPTESSFQQGQEFKSDIVSSFKRLGSMSTISTIIIPGKKHHTVLNTNTIVQ